MRRKEKRKAPTPACCTVNPNCGRVVFGLCKVPTTMVDLLCFPQLHPSMLPFPRKAPYAPLNAIKVMQYSRRDNVVWSRAWM